MINYIRLERDPVLFKSELSKALCICTDDTVQLLELSTLFRSTHTPVPGSEAGFTVPYCLPLSIGRGMYYTEATPPKVHFTDMFVPMQVH
jgi:hypothetical protein